MSDKRFGTIETIQLIFQYPDTFFDLIRLMDKAGDISVPEHELIKRVDRNSRRVPDKDKKRLCLAFRTENLISCGLISIDKKAGTPYLYFERSLIDLLRVCDRSLRQDLTNAKLKARLSSLRTLRKQVFDSKFIETSDEFKEASREMSAEINNIVRLIHGNVRDLDYDVSARMEEISSEIALAKGMSTQRHYELLGTITTIYNRHILPTLEFLNENHKLKDGRNLYQVLESLGKAYRQNAFYELADQIDRSLLSLTQTYKPIQSIANKVQDFVAKNQTALKQHNAMEHAFEKLRDLLSETQTNNLTRTQMKGDSFVEDTGFVAGLVTKMTPSLIEMSDSPSAVRLFHSDLEARTGDASRVEYAPDLTEIEAVKTVTGVNIDRSKELYKWVKEMKIPETNDLVAHLHDRLESFVNGYDCLVDLMDSLSYLTSSKTSGINIVTTNRQKTLEDDGRHFIYRLRRVEKTIKEA